MNPLIMKHKTALMAVGIAVVVAGLAGLRWISSYSSGRSRAPQAAASVEAPATISFLCKKVNFEDNLVMTGTIQGGAQIEFRFNRDGRVGRIPYRVGDKVKKGAVIMQLDTDEAQLKLQQAESELSQAVDLYRTGAIAKPRLTQVQLAAQLARKEFERSFLRAPRDGSIGEINTEVGEQVTPQNTVATLVSIDTVFVEMGVIEKDLGKLQQRQTVDIEVETYPGAVFKGRIAHIAPQVEGTSRTRLVRAEISNEKGALLPGMFARTKIFVQEKPNVLVVPQTAIRLQEGKASVFTLAVGNKAKETPVELGLESADWVEVTKGLNEGDRIVHSITPALKDGLAVEVIEEKTYEGETKGGSDPAVR